MDMLGEEAAGGERRMNGGHCLGPVSFKRMVASGQASTVIAMLIDIHKFWAYDNRESLGSGGGDEEGEEGSGEGALLPNNSSGSGGSESPGADRDEDQVHDGGGSGRRGPGGVAPRSFGTASSGSTPAALLRAQLGNEGGDDDDPYDF